MPNMIGGLLLGFTWQFIFISVSYTHLDVYKRQMKISERTVKNHISSIFKKLEVTDRTQAAVFAIRNNIIQIM